MIKQQTYTLFKVIAERGRYAKVTISVDQRINNQPLILIDDQAIDSSLNYENLNLKALKDAASAGIEYALTFIDQDIDKTQLTFWVKEIVAHPFDSDPGTVAYAACHAIWALFNININPSNTPQLGLWLIGKQS